jgi:hypothetical protein
MTAVTVKQLRDSLRDLPDGMTVTAECGHGTDTVHNVDGPVQVDAIYIKGYSGRRVSVAVLSVDPNYRSRADDV